MPKGLDVIEGRLQAVPDELVPAREMARIMGVSVPTFNRMRANGRRMGIPMPQVDWGHRTIRYRPAMVLRWGETYAERRRAA